MPEQPGIPGRTLIPDLSRVPAEFRGRPLEQDSGIPPLEQVADEQCFSGVDYHITAVIPYPHRFNRVERELRQLQDALATFDAGAPPPGQSVAVSVLRQRASERQQLVQAIERAQKGLQEPKKPFYKTFGEIQTLSITTRRSIEPVRRLGEASPREFTKGSRTYAGTMIFVLLQEDVLLDLYRVAIDDNSDGEPFFLSDRLPPFNILIQASNERGHGMEGAIFGVELLASGVTLSIDDLFTEQQYTYVARSLMPFAKRDRLNDAMHQLGRGAVPLGRGAISELEPPGPDAQFRQVPGMDGGLGRV